MSHVDNYERLMKLGLGHQETRDFVSALNEEIEMRLENQLSAFRAAIAEQHASFRVHMAERDNMIFGKLAEMSGDIHGIKAEMGAMHKSIDARFESVDKRINTLLAVIGLAFTGTSAIVALSHFIK
ncbi:hypothetical protein ACQUFY_26525 (plasmid) [Robbsia andropogonis]|uniref:hypothetical protein n=1 Tax=Robbsia andropogonis TaxID=28092 RepID=UPI003D2349AE